MSLSVYTDQIPQFEGREVAGAAVQLTGKAPLDDLADVVLEIDDRVQLKATYTVVGVRHDVNKDGQLIRVHTLRPVEMALAPFTTKDEGVIRSMPRALGEKVNTNTGEVTGPRELEPAPEPEREPEPHERGENKAPDPANISAEIEALLPRAAELVVKLKFATVSMLQRKLDIHSISLAERLMKALVDNGIVGPPLVGRPDRDVLIAADDLDDLLEAIAS